MTAAIHVGNNIEKANLDPMADAIVRIMEARADQKTIREGLRALGRLTAIQGVTISHVNIDARRVTAGDEPNENN